MIFVFIVELVMSFRNEKDDLRFEMTKDICVE